MFSRYELILLGLVDEEDLRSHESDYFGSERVYSKDYKVLGQVPTSWSSSEYLNPRLEAIHAAEPKRSYIAWKYFTDMQRTLELTAKHLRPGGRITLVAGSNTIRGTHIDTFGVLVGLLTDLGLRLEQCFHYEIHKQQFKLTRHRTANIIPHDGVAVLMRP
jgi:hypothetical protein